MLWIGLVAMMFASLAVHLGLFEGILKVCGKIGRCPKCSTFWIALASYVMCGVNPVIAIFLSIVFAYASIWFGIILVSLNNIFSKLWERVNRSR